jgi:Tol biopolymer transport system component
MNAGCFAAAFAAAFVADAFGFAQETTRVSVNSSGGEGIGDSYTRSQAISADGRFVTFDSFATNFVSGDLNRSQDAFVHDLVTGITERVSVDSLGREANYGGETPAISADGQVVAFESWATNLVLGDTNATGDIFVHDRSTGLTERVSVSSSGVQADVYCDLPSISADGRFVAFRTFSGKLVSGDTNGFDDIFVHDRSTGITERVSVSSSGVQGNKESDSPTISADGRFVTFASYATTLVARDTNRAIDAFVHDRSTGVTERVSVDSSGAEANGDSGYFGPSISADGRFVAFDSVASNLVAGDVNARNDVFVHDRWTGITERVSVDSSGAEANGASFFPALSADGQIVAFESAATNLVGGDTNGFIDLFVRDRSTGRTELASLGSSGNQGNDDAAGLPSISADGLVVGFMSRATNLVAGDRNRSSDYFVRELCSIDASWSNYGSGVPGTNGVPSFSSRSNPVLGSTVTLDLANSLGASTVGQLFLEFQSTSNRTASGGGLLFAPALTIAIGIPPTGTSFSVDVPHDDRLCGWVVDLQAIEADPGAATGVSFTQGLELVLGH